MIDEYDDLEHRDRSTIVLETPGNECSNYDAAILRKFLALQLEVMLDIRDLLRVLPVTDPERTPS